MNRKNTNVVSDSRKPSEYSIDYNATMGDGIDVDRFDGIMVAGGPAPTSTHERAIVRTR